MQLGSFQKPPFKSQDIGTRDGCLEADKTAESFLVEETGIFSRKVALEKYCCN